MKFRTLDQLRHILKAVSWRIVGTIDTMIISFILTRSVSVGIAIGGFEVFTKTFLYYLHERFWYKYIALGRNLKTADIKFTNPDDEIFLESRQKSLNIATQAYSITLKDRIKKNNHNPKVFWMTGLSGSGKSTIANAFQNELFNRGYQVCVLDGDNVRKGLNKDLDFSNIGRIENIRRLSEVSKILIEAGFIVITASISPFNVDRNQARKIIGNEFFVEVFIDTPIEICEQRDVKGLYKKARDGEILNFTGIASTFEKPLEPDIIIQTTQKSVEECVQLLIKKV
jgi:adenylylsulfate kinase